MQHQLKMTLGDIDPPIWRRVLVPSEFTLFDLHRVIQVVMGWEECHLHEFTIKHQRYALPDPEGFGEEKDEAATRLCDVVKARSKFAYQYDFGDSWNHLLEVEKVIVEAATPGPICVAGKRACPPEDSGGAWGYVEKLKALSDPDGEEGASLREWMGEDFDPERFEIDSINKTLQEVFRPSPRKRKRSGR